MRSWRPDALAYLEAQGFDGHVFVPEDEGGGVRLGPGEDEAQTFWELEGLGKAAAVACWVDRRLPDMPGFTTNVELGMLYMAKPERLVMGFPDGARKTGCLRTLAGNIARAHRAFGLRSPVAEIPTVAMMKEMLDIAMGIARRRGNEVWLRDGVALPGGDGRR